MRRQTGIMRHQDGQALVVVLVTMLILQAIAWGFLSRVNFEQRLAAGSTRSLAALYLAEAGVQKALRMLEEGAPDGVAGLALPSQEALGAGTFTIEALEPGPGGLISIVVRGEVAGARRRLKVLARVGPEALAYGMFASGVLAFDGQARTYLLPHHPGRGGCRCGGTLAAGVELRFEGRRVALNTFRGARLTLREGTITDLHLVSAGAAADPALGQADLVLAGGAQLISGINHAPVTLEDLRRQVEGLAIRRLRARPPLAAPSLDVQTFRALAEANTANAAINAAAGEAGADPGLRAKPHSRYSVEEFETLLDYLKDTTKRTLQGLIFVEGDVHLDEGVRVAITDGSLVATGDIVVGEGARLEVRHGQAARALPGIVVWDKGSIEIEEKAVAIVDGLVLAGGDVEVGAGVLDVIGAVAARNFLSKDGTVVVRYDSGVLATVGLRKAGRGLAELVSWQELP